MVKPHVVHFAGDMDEDAVVTPEDSEWLYAKDLLAVFKAAAHMPWCTVFNCCSNQLTVLDELHEYVLRARFREMM